MDGVPHPTLLAGWVRAIGVLAAAPELQEVWLDSLEPVASWNMTELALEFEEGCLLMPQWVRAGWVAPASIAAVEALNAIFDEMSGEGNAALWTRMALRNHEAWRRVRARAMGVLTEIG